jgi:hypothetical protein
MDDVDTGMPLELLLDQLNNERAILRDNAGNSLVLTRTEWDRRGRPHLLVLPLVVQEPQVQSGGTVQQVA